MPMHNITAMYDSWDAAEAARSALVELGINRDDIELHGNGSSSTPEGEEGGFWHSIAQFLFPDADKHLYSEGIRRGGYLLTAAVPPDLHDRATDLLEMTAPIDIDDRATDWRASGWTGGLAPVGGVGTAAVLGVDAAGYEPRSAEPAREEPVIPPSSDPGQKIAEIEDELGAGPRRELEARRRVRRYGIEDGTEDANLSSRPEEVAPRIF